MILAPRAAEPAGSPTSKQRDLAAVEILLDAGTRARLAALGVRIFLPSSYTRGMAEIILGMEETNYPYTTIVAIIPPSRIIFNA